MKKLHSVELTQEDDDMFYINGTYTKHGEARLNGTESNVWREQIALPIDSYMRAKSELGRLAAASNVPQVDYVALSKLNQKRS